MIKAIVTDIEGTTSSISFVKDVLFPYAREHLPGFVRAHVSDAVVGKLLQDACTEAGIANDLEAVITQLLAWIDDDKKITPLKSLQGLIWEDGYARGSGVQPLQKSFWSCFSRRRAPTLQKRRIPL